MLAVFSLVFAATVTSFFWVLISLGLAELRILPVAPVDTRPRTPSSHSALSSYGLFAPLTLWRFSVSLRPLVQTLGSCPASGALWSPAMPPSLGRGWVTNNNNNTKTLAAPINSRLNVVMRSQTPFKLGRNGCWPSRGIQ